MPSSFKNQTTIITRRKIMKKILVALLSIAIAFTAMQPSQAQDQKVLVIIDTAINSKNFPSIIHEVCFTTVKSAIFSQNMSCPNGELFMEGPGAASAPWPLQPNSSNFNLNSPTFHGDTMVKSALVTEPNTKIVFIRVHNVSSLGNSSTPFNGSTILSALNWVNSNASKYSIDAISISQSGINTDLRTRARSWHIGCTDSSILSSFTNQVSQLNAKNIPTFVATGNDGLNTLVGFPACVPGVIGVGSLANETQLDGSTNTGAGLDMVARGRVSITKYNGSSTDAFGTSVATAVAASSYVNKNTFATFQEYINSLAKVPVTQMANGQLANRGVFSKN
jgi:hypothetical protein